MARTAITIKSVSSYQVISTLTITNGDQSNGMSLDLSAAPRLMLMVRNVSGNPAVDIDIDLPTAKSTYNENVTRTITISGNSNFVVVPLDLPPDLYQTGDLLHIDSADANMDNLDFYAYTWAPTPARGH